MIHASVLLLIFLVGLLVIGGGMATGWLVYRAKRESHEALFPARNQAAGKPIIVDEFAEKYGYGDEDENALPESVRIQNQVFGSQFAADQLRAKDNRAIRERYEKEKPAMEAERKEAA